MSEVVTPRRYVPPRALTDRRFRYVRSWSTDIRETWKRVERRDRLLERLRAKDER